jgi:hypothetical protein
VLGGVGLEVGVGVRWAFRVLVRQSQPVRGGKGRGVDCVLHAQVFRRRAGIVDGDGDRQEDGAKGDGKDHGHHAALIGCEAGTALPRARGQKPDARQNLRGKPCHCLPTLPEAQPLKDRQHLLTPAQIGQPSLIQTASNWLAAAHHARHVRKPLNSRVF